MKPIVEKSLALGVLFLTSSFWLSPLINWIAIHEWKSAASAPRLQRYEYSLLPFRTTEILYVIGIGVTCLAGLFFFLNKLKHDPKNILALDYRNFWSTKFIGKRLMALGVLFLLAPAWCFPFINDLVISMVNKKYAQQAVSFMSFDLDCVGLEFGTTRILYNVGLVVTCLAALLLVMDRQATKG